MAAPYTVLNASDATNFYTLVKYANNGVGGVFMPIMLLVIWFISFIGALSEGRQASRAFIFSSFVAAILAIMLALTDLLNSQYMYFSFILVGIGLIWYKLDNAPGI